MKASEKPNLFEFATSELSQDAFLFWLLSHAEMSNYNDPCNFIARKFIEEVIIEANNPKIKIPLDFTSYIIEPFKQYLNIDVLLLFSSENEKNKFFILLEDKIHASESRDSQIKYYQEQLAKVDKLKEIPIIAVYFKTGYTNIEEINHIKDQKAIFYGLERIEKLFKYDENDFKDDPILKDWLIYFKKYFLPILEAEKSIIDPNLSLHGIYENNYKNIPDELYFRKVAEFLFSSLPNEFSKECYPVNGIGHIDWHYAIYKNNWSNKDKDVSIGFYLVWKGDFIFKIKTSTYEYKSQRNMNDEERQNYNKAQEKIKSEIGKYLTDEWIITNYPLQIAKYDIPVDAKIADISKKLLHDVEILSKIIDNAIVM